MLSSAKSWLRAGLLKSGFVLVPVSQQPVYTLMGYGATPVKTIIDVGANRGQFAQAISEFFPHADLHCFEPLPGPFTILSEWSATQNGRVTLYNCALGEVPGKIMMNSHTEHSPSSSILTSTDVVKSAFPQTRRQESVEVAIATLDQLFPNGGAALKRDILLKLDVQGFEDRVLKGGAALLKACKLVIVEVNFDPLYEAQADFYSVCDQLRDAGLSYKGNLAQQHASDGHSMFADLVFERVTRNDA